MSHAGEPEFRLKVLENNCGLCLTCIRSCPFDAISEEREEIIIDPEKCQYCGICASSCPAEALEIFHYDLKSLIGLIEEILKEKEEIIFACRANAEAEEADIKLPCLGRLPAEAVIYSISRGAKSVKLFPCEESFCRFELGSRVLSYRSEMLNSVFFQLGDEVRIEIERFSSKVIYDERRCIACGNCAFVCPYDALSFSAESTVVHVDEEKCMGCGKCVSICPAFALEIKGYSSNEFEKTISELLEKGAKRIYLGCKWSDYDRFSEINVRGEDAFVPVLCSGFVSDTLILHTLHEGAEKVFVIACDNNECKLEEGNRLAEERVEKLKSLLRPLGIEDRVELIHSSPKYFLEGGK
jgi:Fe-S-cluster-containing hydrogenase component 2